MSRTLRLRNISDEEAIQIKKLASSKTQPANLIQRAIETSAKLVS